MEWRGESGEWRVEHHFGCCSICVIQRRSKFEGKGKREKLLTPGTAKAALAATAAAAKATVPYSVLNSNTADQPPAAPVMR